MTHNPLTGVFFLCVVCVFTRMNIPLAFRPVDVRLMIAYMVDARYPFTNCSPDNTIERTTHGGDHPYHKMWDTIGTVYSVSGWNAMSEREIRDLYKTWISSDTTFRTKTVTPMDVMRAKQRWEQRGWYRYEHKRDGRRGVARRYGFIGAGAVAACFGIVLPTP